MPSKQTQNPSPPPIQELKGGVIEANFRALVLEMLEEDNRFVGLSRYILGIKMFWSDRIETACAGHGFIFFNPDFWMKIPPETQKTVTAHEIWHLILRHLDRGLDFDQDTFGIACDHVINLGLEAEGFTFEGTSPYKEPRFQGMSAEAVYKIIYQQKKESAKSGNKPVNDYSKGKDCPDGQGNAVPQEQIDKSIVEDLVKDALKELDENKTLDQQADENKAKVEEALDKSAGSNPGYNNRLLIYDGVKLFIQDASYEEIFEDYLTDPLSGGKRTFLRPARRQGNFPMRMPGKYPRRGHKNRLTHLCFCFDVSGSVTHHQSTQFLRSARTLKDKLNPTLMTIMLWDTRIVFEKTFREDEKLDGINVRAGGGTSLAPVYKRLRQLNPEAAVIFTDLQVTIPPKPEWETIWFVPQSVADDSTYVTRVPYGNIYRIPEN